MAESNIPQTLLDKIWNKHVVMTREDGQSLIYIDRHFIHDVTAQSFDMLRRRNVKPRISNHTFAIPDHYVPTDRRDLSAATRERKFMIESLTRDAAEVSAPIFDIHDQRQGIVHVVGPEQGLSLPGTTIVCADSHTSTHGAMGALAFGVGATEVSHVLATQTLWQKRPLPMIVSITGTLKTGVEPKDLILALIARIGTGGATGHAIEYAGSTIRALSIEGRLTICNMSIEAGARVGFIAPDDTTFTYLHQKPYSPKGKDWDTALIQWRELYSDADAAFNHRVSLDANEIEPMVTWGTTPEDASPISARVPNPAEAPSVEKRQAMERSLNYMGLTPGADLQSIPIDRAFIGSCTNGRIEDLRSASKVVQGRKVADHVSAWVVPGSELVKAQAEAEGLDRIFLAAGFQWRHSGCSMCLGTNGDVVAPGQRCASTSNRNFVGRQGPGARTHLMSPAMVAAAAVTGHLCDVRKLMAE